MKILARLTIAAASLAFACDSAPAVTCDDIPDGGCPNQGGDTCMDPSCATVYSCLPDGGWAIDYACPTQDAAAMDAPSETTVSDAGYDIDAPPGAFGGPGCIDLQPPDCPLGTVLACGQSNGCCGCEDLYVCADGGWNLWGACTDAGPQMN